MGNVKDTASRVVGGDTSGEYTDVVIKAFLIIEEAEKEGVYQLDAFAIEFQQGVDHKGQPQVEEKGGLLSMTLGRTANAFFNRWALSRSLLPYSGRVEFRNPDAGKSATLTISFINAVCISYQKIISGNGEGTSLKLLLSPQSLLFGTVGHDNGKWKNVSF